MRLFPMYRWAWVLVSGFLMFLGSHSQCLGIAINSDVGLTPAKGQKIVRAQFRYKEQRRDPLATNRKQQIINVPLTFVYGFTHKFSGAVTVPYFHKEQEVTAGGSRVEREASGIGDISFQAKYRLYKKDALGQTNRLSAVGGIKTPTGKSNETDFLGALPRPFQVGTGSWDPFLGIAFTRQTLDDEWDASVVYKFNTKDRGFEFGDILKYTVAYQRRIYPFKLPEKGLYNQVNAVLELNGEWTQNNVIGSTKVISSGGNILFLSPGLQMASRSFIMEASLQIPVVQELNGSQLKTSYVAVASVRWTF